MKLPSLQQALQARSWAAVSVVLCLLTPQLTQTVQGACSSAQAGAVTTISCPDFSGDISILKLNSAAKSLTRTPNNDIALRLAGSPDGCVSGPCCAPGFMPGNRLRQLGTVWSQQVITLDAGASFSTKFQFQLTCPQGVADADGFTFALNAVSNSAGGGGGGLGFGGIPTSFAVEFDTFKNAPGSYPLEPVYGCTNDPNNNHLGIDVNGLVYGCNLDSAAGPRTVAAYGSPDFDLNGPGNVGTAWIDYDGVTVNAYAAEGVAAVKPATPVLTYKIDIAKVLGTTKAYAGFTAGTGDGGQNHDILNWNFKSTFDNQAPVITSLNVPTSITVGSSLPLDGIASDAGLGDSNVVTVTYTLDNGAPVTITGLTPSVTVPFTATLTGIPVGTHQVCLQATDVFGNTGLASCREFVVVAPTPAPTTPAPTTPAPTTPAPTTPAPTTPAPTTPKPTTPAPTTPAPTTPAPTTPAPTTPAPTTPAPTTPAPTTPAPTPPPPISVPPVNNQCPPSGANSFYTPCYSRFGGSFVCCLSPQSFCSGQYYFATGDSPQLCYGDGPLASPSSAPTTAAPVTPAPTTAAPVTPAPTTAAPVTPAPTTAAPVTPAPTTAAPVTPAPTRALEQPSMNGSCSYLTGYTICFSAPGDYSICCASPETECADTAVNPAPRCMPLPRK